MYFILWEFRTSRAMRAAFVRAYGPRGAWARLFARARGFIAVRLVRDPNDPIRFFTVDIWKSRASHAAALRKFEREYQKLDRACERLTTSERRLGDFRV